MDFTLSSAPDSGESRSNSASEHNVTDDGFSVSPSPLISGQTEHDTAALELPRSYGSETLCLMARDPHSLFAYWDINWSEAFGEKFPSEREVHLRIRSVEDGADIEIEVQPTASGHVIETVNANAGYTAELGYYDPAGAWTSVAKSAPVNTPPAFATDDLQAEVATVPFHLSFQRMLDMLKTPGRESESLTTRLADLRARTATPENFTVEQRELADTIDQAIALAPTVLPVSRPAVPLWTPERLQQILGFSASSLTSGFSGGSGTV